MVWGMSPSFPGGSVRELETTKNRGSTATADYRNAQPHTYELRICCGRCFILHIASTCLFQSYQQLIAYLAIPPSFPLRSIFYNFVVRILYEIEIVMGLKPYLGLRGNALLRAAVMLVVGPTFTCYGYNMSVAGGLLTLPAFNLQFPRMDTITTHGALQHENSQIQGMSPIKY